MKCGNTTGYAAKYYFVHKEYDEDYKKEPWFFGDMSREEAEHLLGDNANPDGQLYSYKKISNHFFRFFPCEAHKEARGDGSSQPEVL